jgi:aspartyl/asparaginyl beta-hydroxylase (cupin superfamily)
MSNIFLEEQLNKPPHSQTKINEDFNFKKHLDYDVSKIYEIIENFTDEWNIQTIRQEMFDVHKNTHSYFIYDHTTNWIVGDSYQTVCVSGNQELLDAISPIISDLEKIHEGRVAKVLLIKLSKGEDVLPHSDSFDYANSVRRHHIPIITNEHVCFKVGEESRVILTGECLEINNSKIHEVINESDSDRVHLLIDIFPNRYFKEVN